MPLTLVGQMNFGLIQSDAIVNPTNPSPTSLLEANSVIYNSTEKTQFLEARHRLGIIARGEAVATSAYSLRTNYIIHTVGPRWGGRRGFGVLRSCYRNSILLAQQLGCRSIAFPLIASGKKGFPKDKVFQTALEVFKEYLENSPFDMHIFLLLESRDSCQLSADLHHSVEAFIDENYVEHKSQEGSQSGQKLLSQTTAYRASRSFFKEPQDYDLDYEDKQVSPELSKRDSLSHSSKKEKEFESNWKRSENIEKPNPNQARKHSSNKGPVASIDLGNAEDRMSLSIPAAKVFTDKEAEASFSAESIRPSYSAGTEETVIDKRDKAPAAAPNENRRVSQRNLEDLLDNLGESFQHRVLRLIDERGLTDAQVYKKANLDRRLFSKIRSNEDYIPSKRTALALAIALHLGMEDTRDLLASAGLALSDSSKADVIIRYCIQNGIYDIFRVNALLFSYTTFVLG